MGVSHHSAAAWAAVVLAVVAAIIGVRVATPWLSGTREASAEAGAADEARIPEVAAPPLAEAARRLQAERKSLADTRRRVADLLAEAATYDRRTEVLTDMLDLGRLTEAPAFLREEPSVQALQGLLREASSGAHRAEGERDRRSAAAAIARERLRLKLRLLRDASEAEAEQRRAEAETLRDRMRLGTEALRESRNRLLNQLDP